MRWTPEPVRPPYSCALCGNDASHPDRRPFLHTDFTYMENDGREGSFQMCALCIKVIAEMEGSPVRAEILRGRVMTSGPPTNITYKTVPANTTTALEFLTADEIAGAVADELDRRKKDSAAKRMAVARAARGTHKE